MKKILLFVFTALLGLNGLAQTGTTGSLTWSLNDDKTTLNISGTGDMPDYSSAISQNSPPWWFSGYGSVTHVVIEEGVTGIGNDAFINFEKLISVTIPQSVSRIGNYAFMYCRSLPTVAIPEKVTSIGNFAFFNSGLTSITLSGNVENIGDRAFAGCANLTSIFISRNAGYIGNSIFSGCNNLAAIHVEAGNPLYASENGVLYNNDKTVLLKYPSQKEDTEFEIPGSVTTIEKAAFTKTQNLTSVTIPESVTAIGASAFAGSAITSILIPETVTAIEGFTFADCRNLAAVTIPENVTKIGEAAFANSGITSVVIPTAITCIEKGTFDSCYLLSSVFIPGNVERIEDYAFNMTPLASVTFSEGLKSIGIKAFDFCQFTSLTIPETVTSIGYGAFAHCDLLTSVILPEGIIQIDELAFADCWSLQNVEVGWNTPQEVTENLFDNVSLNLATLYVPDGAKPQYDEADVWENFGTIIEKAPATPTAMAGINKDAVSVKPVSNGISIETKEALPVSIYNATGQRMYQSALAGNTEIRLNKGVYIVRIGTTSVKTLVK